jgi:hypothetical protein
MVGTNDSQKLKLKAMETYGMCLFLLEMLPKYVPKVAKVAELIECGQCMVAYLKIIRSHGVNLPPEALQDRSEVSVPNGLEFMRTIVLEPTATNDVLMG